MGLTVADLFAGNGQRKGGSFEDRTVCTYDYIDEQGTLLFQTVRLCRPKHFVQRRPGNNGQPWIWKTTGVRRVLYRLPELLQADPEQWLFLCEGEKDADQLISALGLPATTNPMGAGKWRKPYNEALKDRKVAILPDNDPAGQDHAEKVATSLSGTAADVRIVTLPDLRVKGDVSDWIEAGGTREELLALVAKAPSFVPAETQASVPTFNLTDSGNAERFVRHHKARMRYDWNRGLWLCYDGKRWNVETGNEIAGRLAFETARAIPEEAEGRSYEDRHKLLLWAERTEGAARLEAMLRVARSLPPMGSYAHQYDKGDLVLNCANGTLSLRTGKLAKHKPEDMLTKLCPVAYDPEATLPLWDDFLNTVTQGHEATKDFLQTAVGYSLTGDTREDKLFLVHGPAASGKSTFLEAVKSTLGDYAMSLDFESLVQRQQVGGARSDIARLAGARFVISIEVEEGKKLAEALVKSLTGGDTIVARHLYKDLFEFRPQCKLWLACNDAPRVSDTDTGMWRRILRVPFEHVIPRADRQPAVKTILRDPEMAGPAILAWIVRGCQRWQKDGLLVPERIEEATENYRQDQDPIRDFLEDECEFGPECWIVAADLRQQYEQWAKAAGLRYPLGPKEFNRRLESRKCYRKARRVYNDLGTEKVVKCWHGIALSEGGSLNPAEGAENEIPI